MADTPERVGYDECLSMEAKMDEMEQRLRAALGRGLSRYADEHPEVDQRLAAITEADAVAQGTTRAHLQSIECWRWALIDSVSVGVHPQDFLLRLAGEAEADIAAFREMHERNLAAVSDRDRTGSSESFSERK
ncbi:hypothetical protein RA224_09525 [Achromobacter aegrifaciens]|uniref:hypothetical protein n=1 Tax=Achromobacter aegrifaciens TaxID=1287736 RepID=UPI0027BA9D45|nr:hypothetical protein [Achromobacter aegrifaciens]WLW63642.1 hypothetical protein RA224_09525 [Achromobacter aegrifaciens]